MITDETYVSCKSHCCLNHGCKYDLPGCPVENGVVDQDYPCEYCTWALEDADQPYRSGELGTKLTVGYRRADHTLTAMPSAEAVAEAIRKALDGLEVSPGWAISFVGK